MSEGLPDGWNIKAIGDFNFDISDGNYSSKYPKQSEFCQHGIPFIRANNISNSTIINSDLRFISKELHAELKKGHLKYGDILISTRGDIGQLALVPKQFIGSNINAQLVRINSGNKLHNRFLLYFLLFDTTQNTIKQLQTGTALKQLPVGKLKEVEITYPPLPEQKKIAKILTSVDEVIETTETQINKLKDLKKGMMNELLTKGIGHTEFKDSPVGRIPVGWECTKFINFAVLQRGFDLPAQDRKKGAIPIIGSNGIVGFHDEYKVKSDGVVTGRSGSIGQVWFIEENFWALNTSLYIKEFHENSPKFVYYFLHQLNLARFGGGTGVPTLNRNDIHCVYIAYPPLQEQQKIAKILSSIDTNIEQKQAKLTQSKNLKKSLMADLLTGRVRVKVN